jgi:diguanylate cyclase (GGDEF)-like protein
MTVERSGTLYIATNGEGIFLKRPGQALAEHWGTANGLPSSVINASLEDREGNLWIGTYIGGLARLSGLDVINHTEKQGLPSACVFGICPGGTPDSLWLGTLHGAVHYQVRPVPRVLETVRLSDGLPNEWVWKVLRTADGTLWFLTDTVLCYRRPGEKRIRELPGDVPIPRTVPWDVTVDGQGRLWACGEDSQGGLARRDSSGRWESWAKGPSGESLTEVSRVIPRRKGGVWFVSRSSVYSSDGRVLTALGIPSPACLGNAISTIYEDGRGRLWAGSDTGLAVLDEGGRWRSLNDLPGFSNRHVFFIGEDLHGILWINTARGVFRIGDDFGVESFTPDDGLADWETNANGFYCDARGQVWIGTVGGLSQYDPSGRSLNPAAPLLAVESVRLPGRTLDYPRSLDLGWRERNPVFSVAVLSFRNRGRAAYRARLEGMEKEWLPLRSLSELRYTNLPPGNLRLLLQPVNDSGVWGGTVALPIRVRPPFWMTLGFRLSAAFLLLSAAVGVFRRRTLVLRRRNRELEEEVSRRTAELAYLAAYDPLTALLNRRAILSRLDQEMSPERESRRRLGCIMIDLNRFKAVNDTLGHAAGDGVLKDMAGRIRACLRQGDELGRLGGDEFLVVAPGADIAALRAINRRIAGLECRVGQGAASSVVTASCGSVTVLAGSSISPVAVLARADDLLYATKRSGRREFPVEEM